MPSRDHFVGNRYDPKLIAYEQYIYEVILLLGANPAYAQAEANMLVDFEIELARVNEIAHFTCIPKSDNPEEKVNNKRTIQNRWKLL